MRNAVAPRSSAAKATADNGKIRFGAGWGGIAAPKAKPTAIIRKD